MALAVRLVLACGQAVGVALAAPERGLGGGGAFGSTKEALQLAPRAVVPGSRVGGGGLESHAARFPALPGRLEEGDPIEDGAVQARQFLGG